MKLRQQWLRGKPFHYCYVDDFLPDKIADPKLFGGGLHQIFPGGFLDVNIDYNIHSTTKLFRRLNFLIYLNKSWKREYEGSFLSLEEKQVKAEDIDVEQLYKTMMIPGLKNDP